ncbi:MAG: hypothetical protein WCO25_05175 [Candidatus Uhrbacteria bacterium]
MSVIPRILLGIAVMAVGTLMTFKSETMLEWFGENAWAEDKLGFGQSRLFYKILGTLVAFLGIFIMTNIISDILGGVASVFVRGQG